MSDGPGIGHIGPVHDHEYVPVLVVIGEMPSGLRYAVRVECPCGAARLFVNVPAQQVDIPPEGG